MFPNFSYLTVKEMRCINGVFDPIILFSQSQIMSLPRSQEDGVTSWHFSSNSPKLYPQLQISNHKLLHYPQGMLKGVTEICEHYPFIAQNDSHL